MFKRLLAILKINLVNSLGNCPGGVIIAAGIKDDDNKKIILGALVAITGILTKKNDTVPEVPGDR